MLSSILPHISHFLPSLREINVLPVPMVLTMSKSSNLKFIILCWPSEKKHGNLKKCTPSRQSEILLFSEYSFVMLSGVGLSYDCSPSEVSRVIYPFLCLKALSVDISMWWVFHSIFLTLGSQSRQLRPDGGVPWLESQDPDLVSFKLENHILAFFNLTLSLLVETNIWKLNTV